MADEKTPPTPLRVSFASPDAFVQAYCAHPELQGFIVPTHVQVPTGTQLDVTVDFGGGKGLRLLGQVVSFVPATATAQAGIGVRIIGMHATHRQWLDNSVRTLQSTAPGGESNASERHMLRKAVSAKDLDGAKDSLMMSDLPQGTGAIMGIDLGTCNSSACIYIDGKPVIINLADPDAPTGSSRTLPSVVAYDDNGEVTVGAKAVEARSRNPRRTVFGSKRFIGRNYESPAVQSMLARFPYKVVPGTEGRVAIEINSRPINLTTISAKILHAIRDRAEKALHMPISRAVITVPAYYNDNQRNAVVQAGRLAGLTVERILNEPTAAALAYGLLRSKPRRLLVYDLGGGTFDVSVMTVHKDALQVLATAGDTFLGGEDFDEILVKYAYEQHFAKTQKPLSQSPTMVALLKAAAESAKIRLSQKDSVMMMVRDATLADGTTTRLEVEITRAEFEKRVDALVMRTLKICDMALREAQMTADQLGDVILVGGQTRMPLVQTRVRDHFKRAPRCDLSPDEVVALGAGMLAHLPKEAAKFQDVLSMSIGVNLGGRFKPLIPRNSALPCIKQVKLSVRRSEWATYVLELWQGDAPELHRNEQLGVLKVDAVQPGPQDPVPIRIDLALTPDCLLKVRITNLATEESQSVMLNTRDT